MRRILKIFAVFICVLVLAGCGNEEQRVVKCTLTQNNVAQGYKVSSEYKIYTDGKIVNKVETTEIATSDNSEILDYLENYENTLYTNMNNEYGGYDFKITNENGTLTAITKIDYTKLDMKKLAKDQSSMKNYMNDKNEITLEGIKALYKSMGATCEK